MTVQCRQCSTWLTVVPNACAVQCTRCYCVTRVPRPCAPAPLPVAPVGFPCARGKKRAVLIGITYAGMRPGCGQLSGPINDVKCMRQLLCQRFGFPSDCVLVLTDDHKDPCRLPTRDNILMAMRWLVQGCSSGDSLVFHFSGMGAQVADFNCDEVDGRDECIIPMDSCQKGPIVDDEINQIMVRPLVQGVKLHAIIDACHSATVLDLRFLCRFSRCGTWQWEDHRAPSGACKSTSGGQAVLISGFSNGTSKVSVVPGGCASVGAMTHCFIKAVECQPCGVTYGCLLNTMRTIMLNGGGSYNLQGYSGVSNICNFSGVQEPTLSSSEIFDINCKTFVM